MHPIKKAVCTEIISLLNHPDAAIRKETIIALRKPRFLYSKSERCQIDYFKDSFEWLCKLIDQLCQLVEDIDPKVQEAALATLTTFAHPSYRGNVKKAINYKRDLIIKSTIELLTKKQISEKVLVSGAKLLVEFQVVGSGNVLEKALAYYKNNNNNTKKLNAEKFLVKSIRLLQ